MIKPLQLPKFLNKSNLKECGGELERKNSLQRQSWQKYVTQIVFFFFFFCEIARYEKNSISIFQEFFVSIDKSLISGARLSTSLQFMKF